MLEKQKEKIISYAPFLLVAAVSLLYHLKINPLIGDDTFFYAATDHQTMGEFLTDRYQNWTSRVVIDFFVVSLVRLPLLWKVLDFAVFASLPVLFSSILGSSTLIKWCSAAAVLLYPFHDVGSAGWVTTTINYLWPVWSIVFIGMLLKKMLCHEKISWLEALVSVFASVIVGSHEQAAVVLLTILVLFGISMMKHKIYQLPLYDVFVLINLCSLAFILRCPGNSNRNLAGTADMPEFAGYTLGEKAYLGLLSMERVFIANVDIVFFVVTAVFALLIYIKTDSYKKTLLSSLPVMLLLGQSVIRTAYPGLSGIFVQPGLVTAWSWGELSVWLPMVYLFVTIAAVLYALYQLLADNLAAYIYSVLLLGCGFAAGLVIGFTATIYVSGDRVYITLYFIFLFICMYCIQKMEEKIRGLLIKTAGRLIVTAAVLLCFVNVGYIWLSCG